MFRTLGLLTAFILVFGCPSVSRAGILEIPGTGSCQTILEKLAQAFNQKQSDITVVVPPSIGSSGGIREALADRAEIARVARRLEPKEIKEGLSALSFAKDLLVFTVGRRVGVKKLSLEHLQAIYAGQVTNWSEVGGQDMPIRVLSRQPGDTNLSTLQKQLKGFRENEVTKRAKILYTDQEMIDMIKKYPSAIGFGTRSELLLQGITNALTIGDLIPDPLDAASGKYPLTSTYYLIFKENRLSSKGKRFLDFVFSKNGQALITQFGLIPLRR